MGDEMDDLFAKAERATPGPWHHCQPFQVVPKQRTIHGPVPEQRVDYVSTWAGPGTPKGHHVVVPMSREDGPGVRSNDMAFIAAANPAVILALRDRLKAAEQLKANFSDATQSVQALENDISEIVGGDGDLEGPDAVLLRGPEVGHSCEAIAAAVSRAVNALRQRAEKAEAERDLFKGLHDDTAKTVLALQALLPASSATDQKEGETAMGELTKEQNSVFRDTFFHVIGHGISPDNVNKLCAALASRGLPIAPIAPVTALEVAGEKVTLAECPIGLFLSESGTLALKTEYESDEGRIDAFIVESGEFFWGAPPQSIASQRGQIVTPLAPYRKEEAGNG